MGRSESGDALALVWSLTLAAGPGLACCGSGSGICGAHVVLCAGKVACRGLKCSEVNWCGGFQVQWLLSLHLGPWSATSTNMASSSYLPWGNLVSIQVPWGALGYPRVHSIDWKPVQVTSSALRSEPPAHLEYQLAAPATRWWIDFGL